MYRMFFAALFAATSSGGVVVDRIAVIAGKHAIKASDIDRDVRLTDFLNREPLKLDAAAERQAAERLIDQEIIRAQLVTDGFRRPSQEEGLMLEKQFVQDHFSGSAPRLRSELMAYGITEEELCEQLLWQLSVLRFIDQRFRASATVSDDDVRAYFAQHRAELEREHPGAATLQDREQDIRNLLEGDQVNRAFEDWLDRARKRTRVEYHQEAFQ